jgi:hypothetical protein
MQCLSYNRRTLKGQVVHILCIQGVLILNLVQVIDYCDCGLSWVSSVAEGKHQNNTIT